MHTRVGLRPTTRGYSPQTRRALERRIMCGSRCRQCGRTTRGRVQRTDGTRYPLCGTCSCTGYARLMTRREVAEAMATTGYRIKKRRLSWTLYRHLTIAKRSRKGAHLYWPSEVASRLGLGSEHEQ